jgi:predicted NodU family carbamoyl transferase
MANISITGSHNAAVAIERDNKIISVIEIERLLNYKNSGIVEYKPAHTKFFLIPFILEFIRHEFNIHEFENCFYLDTKAWDDILGQTFYELIPAANYIKCSHHAAHAAGTFYQSSYQSALVFSFDGGGDDGFFNVYKVDRKLGGVLLGKHDIDLGFPYMSFGAFLDDIKYEPFLENGNLVYPGKLMGLCAFGNVLEEFLPVFKDYYYSRPSPLDSDCFKKLNRISDAMGIEFNTKDRLKGQIAYDIAATSQRAFEECFLEISEPYIVKDP